MRPRTTIGRIFTALEQLRAEGGIPGNRGRPRMSLTVAELAKQTHAAYGTVHNALSKYIREHPGGLRQLYIAGWERTIGSSKPALPAPRWGLGNHQHAKRPTDKNFSRSAAHERAYFSRHSHVPRRDGRQDSKPLAVRSAQAAVHDPFAALPIFAGFMPHDITSDISPGRF